MITTGQLAVELDVHKSTICVWARTRLRFARWSRGKFLVQKLRDMGVLPRVGAA